LDISEPSNSPAIAHEANQTGVTLRGVWSIDSSVFGFFFGNRATAVIRFSTQRLTRILKRRGNPWQGASIPRKTTNKKGKYMKKLLLIVLVASGFAFASAPRSDAGVAIGIGPIGIGVGVGYPYYGYYPYGYYRPYYYYSGPSYYWYNGHRVYRHHRHHYYRHQY
jgi:hypothetical protein